MLISFVTGTAGRFVMGAAMTLIAVSPAAAMPQAVAISAGSFFAAATQCETRDLISAGQTAALRKALDRYLSASDRRQIEAGYNRGLKDSTLYVVELKSWEPFTPDSASCYRVQGVLDDYKSHLDPA
ncbi:MULTISPECIES: hypothetical protein [unclassified Tardiphaga]|uniref:hypothetical protein n=1 Tax=unclassified Tardiphaga TaxID=2631404 RepID=UPI001FEF7776|nr:MULTISPECIES: hypothetical protein [unclassified Tardiphaga]